MLAIALKPNYCETCCRRERDIRTRAREGAGRKEGRYARRGNRSKRGTRGRAKAAFGQDLLRLWAALGRGRLRRRDRGREREPVRRGGGDSAWRLRLLPGREAPRGGERRPRHRRHLLHGGRQHRPDPRHRTLGSRIRLVNRLRLRTLSLVVTSSAGFGLVV